MKIFNFTAFVGNEDNYSTFYRVLTYIPLVLICMGVSGNMSSLVIFRRYTRFKYNSSMVYLSVMSVTDTLSLFCWNLDHYLIYNQCASILIVNKFLCKLAIFVQFFSLQSSALLLSAMSVDRYIHVAHFPGSRMSKLPFRTAKSAFVWSVLILVLVFALNSHILVCACDLMDESLHVESSYPRMKKIVIVIEKINTVYTYKNGFLLFPTWERIHMGLYVLFPFFIMIIANSLIIRTLYLLRKNALVFDKSLSSSSSYKKKMKNILTLLALTFIFLLMTLPNSIVQAFLDSYLTEEVLVLCDCVTFLNHSSLFFLCLLTNVSFRRIVRVNLEKLFYCRI